MSFYHVADRFSPRSHSKTLGLLFSAFSLGMLLSGCGNGDSTTTFARVRALNVYVPLSSVDGSVVVTTGGAPITGSGTNLAFGQFANGGSYTTVSSGAFVASLTGPSFATAVPYQTTLNGNNAAYTLVVEGEQGQTGTLTPQMVVIPNFTANQISIPSGSAAIRVVNVSLTTNPIGLYSTTSGTPSAALASTLGSVAYGYNSSTNGYVAVPTAQITNLALVDITNATSALSLSSTSNLTTNPPSFVSGQAYTLYVYGQSGNSVQPLGATWVQDYP